MFRARSIRPRLAFTPDRINVERPLLKSEIKGNEIDQACGKSGNVEGQEHTVASLVRTV